MKCVYCNHEIENICKDIIIIDSNGNTRVVKDIPVKFCANCKQVFYEKKISNFLDEIKSTKEKEFAIINWRDQDGK